MRVRSSGYRLIYEVQEDVLLVMVVRVAHRRDAYRNIWAAVPKDRDPGGMEAPISWLPLWGEENDDRADSVTSVIGTHL